MMISKSWISAILNLIFPGAGYIYSGRKLLGSIILPPTLGYQLWYYLLSTDSATRDTAGVIYSVVCIVLAIHVYRLVNITSSISKNVIKSNKLSTIFFIGLFALLLLVDIALFADNLSRYLHWTTKSSSGITLYRSMTYVVDQILAFSLLIIPILSNALKSVKVPIIKIIASFLVVLVIFICLVIWNVKLDSKELANKQSNKYTSEELLNAFNSERSNYLAQALKHNPALCKISDIRINELLSGSESFDNPEELRKAYYQAKDEEDESGKATKENHINDTVFELVTDTNVEESIKLWSEDITASYVFSDDKFEYGCVSIKNGRAILIVGYDEEPFKRKIKESWNTRSS